MCKYWKTSHLIFIIHPKTKLKIILGICEGTGRRNELHSDYFMMCIDCIFHAFFSANIVFFFPSLSVFYHMAKRFVFFFYLTLLALLWKSWPTFWDVYSYCFWAICSRHVALYIFLSRKTTNKRPNEWQPNLGETLTVTVESNHPSSSSNSPHLSLTLSLGVFTSLALLSQSPFPHGRGLSAQSVCSGCVWPCMHVHFVIVSRMPSVCDGAHVAADKLGRFGQGSGTFTSICKWTTENTKP